MYRKILTTLSVFFVSFNGFSMEDNCYEPFADKTTKFYLQSKLTCGEESTPERIAILGAEGFQEITNEVAYMGPTCFGEAKVLQLYRGKVIFNGVEYDRVLHWSDNIIPDDSSLFKVLKTCDGESLGIIDNKIQDLTLSTTNTISTCFQFRADNANQTLTGYVAVDGHDSNTFKLKDPSNKIIVSAKRSFEKEGDTCFSNWEVENPQGFNPTSIAYAIGWKENQAFSCTSTGTVAPTEAPPAAVATSGLSGGEIAGIVTGTAVGATVVGCLLWKFFGKKKQATLDIAEPIQVSEYREATTPHGKPPLATHVDPIKSYAFVDMEAGRLAQ
ncbi:MAG: hypothetical protein AB8C84_13140 [Oligoflexales bacterium]